MTRFRRLSAGASLALAVVLASCSVVFKGEPVPCEHDADCGSGFICEGTVGRVCTLAIECTGNSQCPVGSSCIERSVSTPDNAFEGNHASKQVCDCLGDCGTGGFNAGGAPPVGGQGGSGGEPAGGQGGEPAGGQGGEPAGGEGGQGGSGGDPQGGAGGQGGAQ